jgi:glycosyltransferase involved in cell wall biosynthesis
MVRVAGHAVRRFLPRSETFTYTQIGSLSRYRSVVFALGMENETEFPGLDVRDVAARGSFAWRSLAHLRARALGAPTSSAYRLEREARTANCALLHAHFGWMGIASLYAARRLRLPLVTTFHARDITSRREDLVQGYPRLFATGTLFTAVGPGMARLLAARGCPEDRIRIVKLGVELSPALVSARRERRSFAVLQVARLTQKKGVELTLRAFASVREMLPASELWIVGDGEDRTRLVSLAQALGLESSVTFFGALPHARTLDLMHRASLGVQPSVTAADGDMEGTPTVILEMQAAALPIVASDHADIRTIVPEPADLIREGSVDELASAILSHARLDDDARARVGERGRAFVRRAHSLRATAAAIETVYDEAIELGGPRE